MKEAQKREKREEWKEEDYIGKWLEKCTIDVLYYFYITKELRHNIKYSSVFL